MSPFKGVFTAVATPFHSDGSIDWDAYSRILDTQVEAKLPGVVICGTTGESPTLDSTEKRKLIETAVKKLKGKMLVIAGTGSNDTRKSIEDSVSAEKIGADALLLVTPYYNKPSQTGMENHFKAIADQCKIPAILYNVPGRTAVSLSAKTVASLAEHPNIVGIKEATGNMAVLTEMKVAVKRKEFVFLSGDDLTYLPFLAAGGDGVISVASNVIPRWMNAIQNDRKRALELFDTAFPFFAALFVEANPVPVKTVLSWKNLGSAHVRLPLAALSAESLKKLKEVWESSSTSLREDRP